MSEPEPRKQVPSVGRIVHFVMSGGKHTGEHRPAVIVKVWSDEMVNLQVFTDGDNDYDRGPNTIWATSIHLDEDGKAPHTFHFPEFVPPR